MHGLPRRAPTPKEEEALSAKARDLRALQTQLLSNHHSKIYTEEPLHVSAKLLQINPDCYTAWNYRNLAVQHHLLLAASSDSKSILDVELQLVEDALEKNYKSYGAWHHRKWVLSKGHCSLDYELKLLNKFQTADSRNFHAWDYKRFVAALLNRSEKEELDYTTEMIENNFSNYSAWHNRRNISLVLYFNQAVRVNSSTVTIESLFCKEDLAWKPLLQVSTQVSQVWVTCIRIPEANSQSEEAWLLEVSVRLSQGIVSSGFDYSHTTRFTFKVCPSPVDSELCKKQGTDQILWIDENFSLYQTPSDEPHESLSTDNLIIHHVDEANDFNLACRDYC